MLPELHAFRKKIHSQFGCDGITLELVRRLNPPRYFVEIGAGHDGENNTHVLLDEGWHGLWIDRRGLQLSKAVHGHPHANSLTIRDTFVTTGNIAYALRDTPQDVGVFSLDVDGNDYWLWKALPLRPWLCIIECNVQKPMDEPHVMPYNPQHMWDHTSHEHGASVYSMIELGKELGYTFVGMASDTPPLDSPNAYFVRDDLTGSLD